MQRTTNDMQRATGNMRQTSSNMQRTTTTCNATDTVQQATGSGQRATNDVEKTTDGMQRTTDNKATETKASMRHAADTAQKTVETGNACNRQRASDSKQHARGREHMRDATRKHTALPHFGCGKQRKADNQQHARSVVLDNQCATRHRRHTGNKHGTDNTQQAMQCTG